MFKAYSICINIPKYCYYCSPLVYCVRLDCIKILAILPITSFIF